jgi:hypothetical protein
LHFRVRTISQVDNTLERDWRVGRRQNGNGSFLHAPLYPLDLVINLTVPLGRLMHGFAAERRNALPDAPGLLRVSQHRFAASATTGACVNYI